MIERIQILQALRLKGRALPGEIAAATGLPLNAAEVVLGELARAGFAEDARGRLKLTAAGRDELTSLLAGERAGVDQAALIDAYHEFDVHNAALKGLMTRWQLVDDTTPNDHSDPAYDAAVICDLVALDAAFRPLLDRFVDLAGRLAHYAPRFDLALERIASGDHTWFARPLADSYHTVWFELHEDLIGLAGLTRADEAAAGRAL